MSETEELARHMADRLAVALAGLDQERCRETLEDWAAKLLQAMLDEGVPLEQAVEVVRDVTVGTLVRLRHVPHGTAGRA